MSLEQKCLILIFRLAGTSLANRNNTSSQDRQITYIDICAILLTERNWLLTLQNLYICRNTCQLKSKHLKNENEKNLKDNKKNKK